VSRPLTRPSASLSRYTGSVIVFDADKLKAALSVKEKLYSYKEGPLESWPSGTIALSPDGTQLLMLYGQVLKAFRVPSKTS
jgi:hypothetical protein